MAISTNHDSSDYDITKDWNKVMHDRVLQILATNYAQDLVTNMSRVQTQSSQNNYNEELNHLIPLIDDVKQKITTGLLKKYSQIYLQEWGLQIKDITISRMTLDHGCIISIKNIIQRIRPTLVYIGCNLTACFRQYRALVTNEGSITSIGKQVVQTLLFQKQEPSDTKSKVLNLSNQDEIDALILKTQALTDALEAESKAIKALAEAKSDAIKQKAKATKQGILHRMIEKGAQCSFQQNIESGLMLKASELQKHLTEYTGASQVMEGSDQHDYDNPVAQMLSDSTISPWFL